MGKKSEERERRIRDARRRTLVHNLLLLAVPVTDILLNISRKREGDATNITAPHVKTTDKHREYLADQREKLLFELREAVEAFGYSNYLRKGNIIGAYQRDGSERFTKISHSIIDAFEEEGKEYDAYTAAKTFIACVHLFICNAFNLYRCGGWEVDTLCRRLRTLTNHFFPKGDKAPYPILNRVYWDMRDYMLEYPDYAEYGIPWDWLPHELPELLNPGLKEST